MDVERTIQFLLEQQARFDARQAEFDTRHAKFAAKFEEDITQINGVMVSVATAQQRTNAILETLAQRHLDLADSHKEMASAQRSTEQKLHAVISALERHIANHE